MSVYDELSKLLMQRAYLQGGGGQKDPFTQFGETGKAIGGAISTPIEIYNKMIKEGLDEEKARLENEKAKREGMTAAESQGFSSDISPEQDKAIKEKALSEFGKKVMSERERNTQEMLGKREQFAGTKQMPVLPMTEGIEPQTRDITEEELMSSVAQERPELLQPQEPTSQFVEPKLPYAEYQKTPLGEYNPKLTLGQIKQMADIGLKDVIYYDKTTGTTSQTPTANSIAIPLSKMGIPKQNIIRGSEPVIESKLASRDYVNSLLEKAKEPQLKEGEDITRYQFDKLASMYGKEAQAEIPQNIPSQQITDIAKMKEGISLNKSIRSQFFDLISKGKSPVDPIKGRWVDLERQWGTLSDEEVSKFTADIAQQFNTYLNNLSGAAISPDEAVRLEKRVNKAKETPAQFLGTLSSIDDEISRKISSRVETLKQSNFRVGDLEQYIIKETKPPKPKDTLPEIAKGKVKLAGGKEVEFNNGQVWKWDSVKKEAIRVK